MPFVIAHYVNIIKVIFIIHYSIRETSNQGNLEWNRSRSYTPVAPGWEKNMYSTWTLWSTKGFADTMNNTCSKMKSKLVFVLPDHVLLCGDRISNEIHKNIRFGFSCIAYFETKTYKWRSLLYSLNSNANHCPPSSRSKSDPYLTKFLI